MAHEAFIVPTDVSYTALGFDRKILGLPFTGAWAPASRALTLDFLWNEVRVKGGAYGVGFQATRMGNMRFYTYRDPHLDESLERFAKAVPWLASFDPTPEDMTGYQVSSVATMDEPQKPRRLIRRQDTEFFSKRLPSERIKARSEIIEATVEGIRALAEPLQQVIEQGAVCTFGNKDIIASSKRALDVVDLLNE